MSTTTLPAPLPSIEVLACGCPTHGHNPGCTLDTAEQISAEAIATAGLHQPHPVHPLIAALTALDDAGLLRRPMDDVDSMDYMLPLLDDLYTDGLLGPDGGRS